MTDKNRVGMTKYENKFHPMLELPDPKDENHTDYIFIETPTKTYRYKLEEVIQK